MDYKSVVCMFFLKLLIIAIIQLLMMAWVKGLVTSVLLALRSEGQYLLIEDLTCTQPGKCSQGVFLSVSLQIRYVLMSMYALLMHIFIFSFKSAQTCLDQCSQFDACTDFTYNFENENCLLFNGCSEVSEETCSTCATGNKKDCLDCFRQGLFTLVLLHYYNCSVSSI